MRRFTVLAAAAALTLPVVANAQGMTVATFLTKVDALRKKGMMAMFSPDVKLIKAEMQRAGVELQAEKKARDAAGKPPFACPPKDQKMGSEEFLAAMRTIPVAEQRTMSLKAGLVRVMTTKYPCKK